MNTNTISTNPRGIQARIVIAWLLVLTMCGVISLALAVIMQNLPQSRNVLLLVVWTTLPLLWLIGSIKAYKGYKKGRYELKDDSLVVYKGGIFGTSSKLYRYDSIVSVEVQQSYFGKKHNYGTLYITIPRLETVLRLRDIDHPHAQAEKLKAVSAKRTQTQSMVV
jgi:uncharacterized membrane protein YdbT with pleckstrin-like domain